MAHIGLGMVFEKIYFLADGSFDYKWEFIP